MEYDILGDRAQDLVRLDVKINGALAEPLATICHRCALMVSHNSCWLRSMLVARLHVAHGVLYALHAPRHRLPLLRMALTSFQYAVL